MKQNQIGFEQGIRSQKHRAKWRGIGILAVAATAALAASPSAGASAKCVDFDGLRHCAVGGATLELTKQSSLIVHNAGGDIKAGLSIDVPDVRAWHGHTSIDFAGGANDVFKADSISDGVVTSRAQIKRNGQRFQFTAAFTGSVENRAYRVDVLLNGAQQGVAENVPSGLDGGAATTGAYIEYDMDVFDFIVQPNGACQWDMHFSTAGGHPITLPNGLVVMGDEIRMTEQVKPAGAYPYTTFDGLVFQGNFRALDFASEFVE
jgi:hypothetical protein